jgi:hypothetical protein
LVKHKNPVLVLQYKDLDGNEVVEEHNGVWSLYDRQGANLGDINEDRFDNAGQIIERLDIYINDYFYADLEDELDAYEVDLEGRELPRCAETWLALRDDRGFYEKNQRYFDEHKWEFDVLDMIAYHADEINLEECYYENED